MQALTYITRILVVHLAPSEYEELFRGLQEILTIVSLRDSHECAATKPEPNPPTV